jgi:tetratricopeptide (TPR) repeat protein
VDEDGVRAAWAAYELGEFATAVALWEQLLAACPDEADRDSLRSGQAYALVGLRRFDEAREIYRSLYARTRAHIYLHQLGMVEREAGCPQRAADLFEQERSLLAPGDALALAANLYERALVASLLGNGGAAKELGRRCMAASLETADPVMHGCAYRLLGDLARAEDPNEARRHYDRALAAFAEAGDQTACDEIDVRLEALP